MVFLIRFKPLKKCNWLIESHLLMARQMAKNYLKLACINLSFTLRCQDVGRILMAAVCKATPIEEKRHRIP